MTRKTAKDFEPEVLQLFDQYVHGDISRRGFLQSAARVTAGTVAAEALLAALSPNFAQAEQVAPRDPRIEGKRVEFPSPNGYGKVSGYLLTSSPAQGRGIPTALNPASSRDESLQWVPAAGGITAPLYMDAPLLQGIFNVVQTRKVAALYPALCAADAAGPDEIR